MMAFLCEASEHFSITIFSSRSNQPGGMKAMQDWLWLHVTGQKYDPEGTIVAPTWLLKIEWPLDKPPAMITIDDRALTFDGTWPPIRKLLAFKPWNKQ